MEGLRRPLGAPGCRPSHPAIGRARGTEAAAEEEDVAQAKAARLRQEAAGGRPGKRPFGADPWLAVKTGDEQGPR